MVFRRRIAWFASAVLALSGCRHNQAARELLERELRWQEDRIYELEAKLQDAERDLDRVRGRGGMLESDGRDAVPPFRINSPSDSHSRPVDTGAGRIETPSVDSATPRTTPSAVDTHKAPPFQGPPTISPPSIQIPEGVPSERSTSPSPTTTPSDVAPKDVPSISLPPTPKEPAAVPSPPSGREPPSIPPPKNVSPPFKTMSSPKFVPPSARPRLLHDEEPSVASSRRGPPSAEPTPGTMPIEELSPPPGDVRSADPQVVELTLSLATGGFDLDGKPGDDGVRVVLEPRNGRGQIVPADGAVSIVAIDPATSGEAGRFARWDFQPGDSAGLYRPAVDRDGAGIYFELPWPETPPAHARLRLFARLTTSDGKTLQADREVQVRLDGVGAQAGRDTGLPAGRASVVRAAGGRESNPISTAVPATSLNWGSPSKETPATMNAAPSSTPPAALAPSTTENSIPTSAASGPALIPAIR